MICNHVIALIEGSPFAEWRPDQNAAVEEHVRTCAACQRALDAARAMEIELSQMAEPDVPLSMVDAIASRIEISHKQMQRQEELRKADQVVPETKNSQWAWIILVAGTITIAAGVQWFGYYTGKWTANFIPSLVNGPVARFFEMPQHLAEMSHVGPSGIVLVAMLLMYFVVQLEMRRI